MNAKKQFLLKQLTLVLMLTVFTCQLFFVTNSSLVHYPDGKHLMGTQVSHHHSHNHKHLYEKTENYNQLDSDLNVHEHANHTHTVFYSTTYVALTDIHYLSHNVFSISKAYENVTYAPPIPPPTA
ncbi:hypothetical protein CJF42_12650 [Pseudoalteromonas sp. NBT06-2]|nr:hypothetical protein CJF42_12650 [Pseudoalteromonas sp. NBT06-2]